MISGRNTSAYVKLAVLCLVLLSVACGSAVGATEASDVATDADELVYYPAESTDSLAPPIDSIEITSAQSFWQFSASDSLVEANGFSLSALPSFVTDVSLTLLDSVLGDSLLREDSARIAFTVFLGRLDVSSSVALQRGDVPSIHENDPSSIQDDVHAAPPIEWMNPSADERLAEIDYFALMLSLTTVLVSIGLVAYRRLSTPHSIQREVEPALAEPESTPSDEERIMRLLEAHDGQMRQVAIVEEVEWSKAKVSRLLSQLDEEGEITKFRLGRENLICVRGCEPEASRSPFAAAPEN